MFITSLFITAPKLERNHIFMNRTMDKHFGTCILQNTIQRNKLPMPRTTLVNLKNVVCKAYPPHTHTFTHRNTVCIILFM